MTTIGSLICKLASALKTPYSASNRLAIISGTVMFGSFLTMTRLDHFTLEGYTFVGLLLIAFVAYSIVVILILNKPSLSLWIIAVFTLLFRFPLLFTPPTLSTDIWRYLWDGRLINEGVNPYQYRVDAPELADLRTPLHTRIEHQWMASPYPPVAQAVFATTYRIFPENARAMQIVFMGFDLLTALLLIQLLRLLGHPPAWVLIYAWNPMIVVEFAHGAHIDSLMTLSILLACYFQLKNQSRLSAFALAIATLTKFIPALLLPIFVPRWGVKNTFLFILLISLAFLPFINAGLGLTSETEGVGIFGAAKIYASEWKTNDGLYYWLVETLKGRVDDPLATGRALTRFILLAAGGLIFLKTYRQKDLDSLTLFSDAALLISLYLLLAFAMFPWYLTWLIALLPLLTLHKNAAARLFAIAWLYFSAAVNLSYLFYLDPTRPSEANWIRQIEYYPLYMLLGVAVLVWLVPLLKRHSPNKLPAFKTLREPKHQHKETAERE